MKRIKILSLLFVTLVTFNCSSDDDDSPAPALTPHQLLMSGKWYLSSVTDVIIDSCAKKANLHFHDETSVKEEVFSKNDDDECLISETTNLSYLLLNDNKKIQFNHSNDSTVFNVELISETKFVYSTLEEEVTQYYSFDNQALTQ